MQIPTEDYDPAEFEAARKAEGGWTFMQRVQKIGLALTLEEYKTSHPAGFNILLIGASGTGKSTMVQQLGGDINIRHGHASDTTSISCYHIGHGVNVIDVFGSNDTEDNGLAGNEHANTVQRRAIRKYLADTRNDWVNLLIWFVKPDTRFQHSNVAGTLLTEARFIHSLVGNSNVIVLVQQAGGDNQLAGPRAAARSVLGDGAEPPPCVPWHVQTDSTSQNLLKAVEEETGALVMYEAETQFVHLEKLLRMAKSLDAVRLVNSNHLCIRCGEVGEPSTWDPVCHLSLCRKHCLLVERRFHWGQWESVHGLMIHQDPEIVWKAPDMRWDGLGALGEALIVTSRAIPSGNPGRYVAEGVGIIFAGIGRRRQPVRREVPRPDLCADCGLEAAAICNAPGNFRWSCCHNADPGAPGCLSEDSCSDCRAIVTAADAGTGCIEYCSGCNAQVGTPAFQTRCVSALQHPHALIDRD